MAQTMVFGHTGKGRIWTVKRAAVEMEAPTATKFMTAAEICDATMKSDVTVDRKTGKMTGPIFDYMQAVADAIFDREYWKAPIVVIDSEIDVQWVIAAIRWFHGCDASFDSGSDGTTVIRSTGYAC